MKAFETVVKILTALAAVAGAIFLLATYGEKIVEWAKKVLASCPCCKTAPAEEATPETAEPAAEETPATEEAPAAEVPAEESPAAEAPAEEPAPEVVATPSEPIAEEADFAE